MPDGAQGVVTTDVGAELLEEVARTFGRVRVLVRGGSMLPAIRPGDVLEVVPIDILRVSVGDVILFRWEERLLAHRVIRLIDEDEPLVITRGDRHTHDDPPVHASQIIGLVSRVVRPDATMRRLVAAARYVAGVARGFPFSTT